MARAVVYGEQLVYSGPLFRRTPQEDGALRIWFDQTGGGLLAQGGALRGFEGAGADRRWTHAAARSEAEAQARAKPGPEALGPGRPLEVALTRTAL